MRCPLCGAPARPAESWGIYGPVTPRLLLCAGPVRHVTKPPQMTSIPDCNL